MGALACPIPVYQYAIENWKPDPFTLVIHHEGEWESAHREAVERLRAEAARTEEPLANLEVELREVSEEDGRPEGMDGHPFLVLEYPAVLRMNRPAWSGQLDPSQIDALLDSPMRRKLGEKLAGRTSAVWLLLESGDRRADAEVERMLRETLDRLVQTLVIPSSADWGGETVAIDDKVSFEVMRLGRNDPSERFLLSMLLNSEPDLRHPDFAGQPMVFPVYGRGLILYALIGRGIHAWTIGEAVEFITGPCSCQIKAANPGTDLLMTMDWDRRITRLAPASVTPAGAGGFLQRMQEAEAEPESANEEPARGPDGKESE